MSLGEAVVRRSPLAKFLFSSKQEDAICIASDDLLSIDESSNESMLGDSVVELNQSAGCDVMKTVPETSSGAEVCGHHDDDDDDFPAETRSHPAEVPSHRTLFTGTNRPIPPGWRATLFRPSTFWKIQKTLMAEQIEAGSLSFSVEGVLVHLDLLKSSSRRRVEISNAVAEHLTGGVLCDTRILQHGRLVRVSANATYMLNLPVESEGNQGRILSLGGSTFFNFLLKQWQPMSRLGAYMPGRNVLYCSFTPADDALFVKVGYHALGDERRESIIRYVEKKTERLRITNRAGAGLFVMPLPKTHDCFADPAKAAEESLKSAIRSSSRLEASPSSRNGELVSFSGSLEYYFIKAQPGEGTSLQALVHALQDFTGNPCLKPLRSVMTPGPFRAGRRFLQDWRGPYQNVSNSTFPLPRMSNMCSRQKVGRFARVSHLSKCLSRGALPAGKRRRRALSCP